MSSRLPRSCTNSSRLSCGARWSDGGSESTRIPFGIPLGVTIFSAKSCSTIGVRLHRDSQRARQRFVSRNPLETARELQRRVRHAGDRPVLQPNDGVRVAMHDRTKARRHRRAGDGDRRRHIRRSANVLRKATPSSVRAAGIRSVCSRPSTDDITAAKRSPPRFGPPRDPIHHG